MRREDPIDVPVAEPPNGSGHVGHHDQVDADAKQGRWASAVELNALVLAELATEVVVVGAVALHWQPR
jgi:hypothetical protein